MGRRKKEQIKMPWDRIPGETATEYAKFCKFRDMNTTDKTPKERTIAKLAQELNFSYDRLRRISAKNKWMDRTAEYDSYLDSIIREKNEEEIVKMRKNHALIASQMIKKATQRLLTMAEDDIAASDVVRLIDVGVKIERLSRGEATENTKISSEGTITHQGEVKVKNTDGINLAILTNEELQDFERLLEKLHPNATA